MTVFSTEVKEMCHHFSKENSIVSKVSYIRPLQEIPIGNWSSDNDKSAEQKNEPIMIEQDVLNRIQTRAGLFRRSSSGLASWFSWARRNACHWYQKNISYFVMIKASQCSRFLNITSLLSFVYRCISFHGFYFMLNCFHCSVTVWAIFWISTF